MDQHTETESLSGGRPESASSVPSDQQSKPASVPPGYGSIERETNYVPRNYSWYEEIQRNKPQSSSLAAASMIFLSGGMSLSLSVGIGPISEYGTHTQYCWFIAIIIGACISAFLAHKTTKWAFNMCASILVIAKGTIYICCPSSIAWTVLARYCDGIAFGLTIIPAILAGSEQSVRKFRGRVLSVEQNSLVIGALLISLFSIDWTDELQRNRAHGIASLVYGLLALMFTIITTVESPIFYLRKNNETEALNVLRQLQRPHIVTPETYALLDENKALLEEDLGRGVAENISHSWIPLVKITILRVLVSLSFSLPLTLGFFLTSGLSDLSHDPNPIVYILMRLIGVTCSVLTIDCLGRRTISALALLIGSIFLLGVGALFSSSSDISKGALDTCLAFLLIHQLLAGLVAPSSTCYLGEAYSLSVKPYFILISIIVENTIQIIVCSAATLDSTGNFAYVLAAVQFIFALVFYFTVPETKQTTLREALDMFKNTVYIRLQDV